MKDIALMIGVLMAWFALARWVLPALGLPTCMSGQCGYRPPVETSAPAVTPAPSVEEEAKRQGVNRLEIDPLATLDSTAGTERSAELGVERGGKSGE